VKKRGFLTGVLLVLGWQLAAMLIHREVVVPPPLAVIAKMWADVQSPLFYQSVAITLSRCLLGLFLAMSLGIALGLVAGYCPKAEQYLSPVLSILKAVPNISVIIILLIWVGAEKSVLAISFFVIFPVFYTNVLTGVHAISPLHRAVLAVMPTSKSYQLFAITLPLCAPQIYAGLLLTSGLGLKVSIMAEILGQVRAGMGKQMYFAKVDFDMVSIFAWTIWIIILVSLMTALLKRTRKWFFTTSR
jgi:ABC-type nitrate/sulfonate/bicarbonate transport system permease component